MKRVLYRMLLVFSIVLAAGCSVASPGPTREPTRSPSLTPTDSPTPTATNTPTIIPAPTFTRTPAPTPAPIASRTPSSKPTLATTSIASTCTPSDQDSYVYNPNRLTVLSPCITVIGVIDVIRHEADGDFHILLRLDKPYLKLLTPGNAVEGDRLVVEPICVLPVSQADAVLSCAADDDPLKSALTLAVGQRVQMQGRYVTDNEHGNWAELHPLYSFQFLQPAAAATATPSLLPAGRTSTPTTAPAPSAGIQVLGLTSPIGKGANATITIHAAPNANCSIAVIYKSGPSKAAGLVPKTTASDGNVSWTWKVGTNTTAGTWSIRIDCNPGGHAQFPFTVQ